MARKRVENQFFKGYRELGAPTGEVSDVIMVHPDHEEKLDPTTKKIKKKNKEKKEKEPKEK